MIGQATPVERAQDSEQVRPDAGQERVCRLVEELDRSDVRAE
jgi:hypothetical protein